MYEKMRLIFILPFGTSIFLGVGSIDHRRLRKREKRLAWLPRRRRGNFPIKSFM
jgi:hypothetical protein